MVKSMEVNCADLDSGEECSTGDSLICQSFSKGTMYFIKISFDPSEALTFNNSI